MIPPEKRTEAVALIKEAIASGARRAKACEVLEITPRTYLRWKSQIRDLRKGALKEVKRRISEAERKMIIAICCNPRFRDLTPYEISAITLAEGNYIGSISSIYRILKVHGMLHHRGNSRPRRYSNRPEELVATGPDQVWCWDITYLKSPIDGMYYYLYFGIDLWARDIVAWEVHDRECETIAAEFIRRHAVGKVVRGLYLHSDNGPPMKGMAMMATLYALGIIPSRSRPRVSNDNAYAESWIKTMKYIPSYPGRFNDLNHARQWIAEFVHWYNTKHLHSGIGYVTTAQRRSGEYKNIIAKRNLTILKAHQEHPERFGKKMRQYPTCDSVILNPRKKVA